MEKIILDAKHTVLFAFYTEYQKDLPHMNSITATSLDLSMEVFNVAVDKLQNEGFIKNAVMVRVDQSPNPIRVSLVNATMTREGLDYVESMLEMQRGNTGIGKAQILAERFAGRGWDLLADLAAKVIFEFSKSNL